MIIDSGELGNLQQDLEGASVALRLGSYDVLHAGHQEGIQYAASQADILVVGVMPDSYVARVKGPGRPLNSEGYRVEAIDAAEAVDYSFVAPGTVLGLARVVQALKPAVYVEGSEHARRTGLLKAGMLGLMGVEYVRDWQNNPESTSLMVARFGREEALARSSLHFHFAEGAA